MVLVQSFGEHEVKLEMHTFRVQLYIDGVLQEETKSFLSVVFGDFALAGSIKKADGSSILVQVVGRSSMWKNDVTFIVDEKEICTMHYMMII